MRRRFTGLRMGELRALRWSDVDFGGRTVFVRSNYTRNRLAQPKSGKVRSVPLIDQAAAALDKLSRRDHFTSASDLVFCNEVGSYLADKDMLMRFYIALRSFHGSSARACTPVRDRRVLTGGDVARRLLRLLLRQRVDHRGAGRLDDLQYGDVSGLKRLPQPCAGRLQPGTAGLALDRRALVTRTWLV